MKLTVSIFAFMAAIAANAFAFSWSVTGRSVTQGDFRTWSGSVAERAYIQPTCQFTSDELYLLDSASYTVTNLWGETDTQSEFVYISFLKGGGLNASTLSPSYIGDLYGGKPFQWGDVVRLGTFGFCNAYQDKRITDAVFTATGSPLSRIENHTGKTLTINGVSFTPGSFHHLAMPLWLEMARDDSLQFVDADTGAAINMHRHVSSYQSEGDIYYAGCYMPFYTGNIRIKSSDTPLEQTPPGEPLLFGSYRASNADKLLHARNEMPIYADGHLIETNFNLFCEWSFDQTAYGSPTAFINGEIVCGAHSTGHVVEYDVATVGMKFYGELKLGNVDFTLTIAPSQGTPGGSCTFRVYDQVSWDASDATHRASVTGSETTSARFRITINSNTGAWSIKPI